ncbi:MAG: preprotein translocase subunit Sec61beta [Candidatus Bathyarchaeia archaeon]
MSRKAKRRGDEAPMPAASAGLLRFYEERTASLLKLRPEVVVIAGVILIVAIVIANMFL